MMMSEADRLTLVERLAAGGDRPWREIVCELHRGGRELPIFVLVDDPTGIPAAFQAVVAAARPWVDRFADTEPSIAFSQLAGNELRTWEYCDADEVRAGALDRPVGRDFIRSDPAASVFATVRTAAGA